MKLSGVFFFVFFVSGVSVCIFVALWLWMCVPGANKVGCTVS